MRKITAKKWFLPLLAGTMLLTATGCFPSYSSYYNSAQNQVKTTAAAESVQDFDLDWLVDDDGFFVFDGLPWGSSLSDLEKFLDVSVTSTNAFSEGEIVADVNYSYKLADRLTVGVQPLYDADGALMSISFYFEQTYTAEQLDEIYKDVVALAVERFGDYDNEQTEDQEANRQTYTTTVTYWYRQVNEEEMTTLQIGKLGTGGITSAVVVGINHYDPTQIEEKSSEARTE